MNKHIITCRPEAGKIYHMEQIGYMGVWIFRYHPLPDERAKLTGCDYCINIKNNGDFWHHDKHIGYIGYDHQVRVLKPANENEIAIFNRVFGL